MAISQRFLLLLICFTVTLHHTFAITEEDLIIYQQPKLNSTVYDLLLQFGFPKGLLPDVVKSYSLSDNGDFEVELERQCYVHFDKLVFYDKKITGKLTYGQISDITGIQAKKLFLWVPVTGIQAEPGSDYIDFYVGFLSEQLPKDEFQRIPACKSKACVMAKDSYEAYLISELICVECESDMDTFIAEMFHGLYRLNPVVVRFSRVFSLQRFSLKLSTSIPSGEATTVMFSGFMCLDPKFGLLLLFFSLFNE